MKRPRRSVSVIAACVLMAAACVGQSAPSKTEYMFHGKVEAVDKTAKNLTVKGEKIEGWMDAMTMKYKVDDPSILDKVKPGDQIMATVYDGDYTLHEVRVMSAQDSNPKK